jgi:hypothetical protein
MAFGWNPAAPAEDVVNGARSPGDMTVDERLAMMKAANAYQNCVYSEAVTSLSDFPDIRQAADFAMGECQGALDNLEGTITGFGMDSAFATAFAMQTRRRAVRKLLPELAIRRSSP